MKSVLESPPFRMVKFPPVGARATHRVRTHDSFVSIARDYGIADPWHLIEYNFNTRNPREVNYYLKFYVGCTESNDGKNYSFRDWDSPGEIHIPPSNWTPSKQERMKRMVTSALANYPANRISFHRSGRSISSRSLATVANLVIDGEIGIVHDSSIALGSAEYDSDLDNFHFNFETAESSTRKALIVHEAVHAYLDYMSDGTILVGESEALAYVAQCVYMYHVVSDPDSTRLTAGNELDDEVFRIGWQIAAKLAKNQTPESIEWYALESAMKYHSKYRTTASNLAGFNGI